MHLISWLVEVVREQRPSFTKAKVTTLAVAVSPYRKSKRRLGDNKRAKQPRSGCRLQIVDCQPLCVCVGGGGGGGFSLSLYKDAVDVLLKEDITSLRKSMPTRVTCGFLNGDYNFFHENLFVLALAQILLITTRGKYVSLNINSTCEMVLFIMKLVFSTKNVNITLSLAVSPAVEFASSLLYLCILYKRVRLVSDQ